jgi:hypothetical protein
MNELLGSKHEQIFNSSLKYVGNVMGSVNKDITDRLLETNVIEKITNILYAPKNETVKLALWILSNFTATNDINY